MMFMLLAVLDLPWINKKDFKIILINFQPLDNMK
jgi:hypothetical protein